MMMNFEEHQDDHHHQGNDDQWIHDWDYKRILPENPVRGGNTNEHSGHGNGDDDVMMIMDLAGDDDADGCDPLSISHHYKNHNGHANGGGTNGPTASIFWSRVPFNELEDCLMMDDNDDQRPPATANFDRVPFEEISHRDLLMQRSASHAELAKFAEAPPLSWEAHQDDDDDHSNAPSVMSNDVCMQDDNDDRHHHHHHHHHPSVAAPPVAATCTTTTTTLPGSERGPPDNASDDIFARQQKLLQEVLQRPLIQQNHQPYHPLPRPTYHQEKLLSEITTMQSHYHQQLAARPPRPTPTSTQEKLLQEMRALVQKREVDDKIFYKRQQELLEELRKQQKEGEVSPVLGTTAPPPAAPGNHPSSAAAAAAADTKADMPPPPPPPSAAAAPTTITSKIHDLSSSLDTIHIPSSSSSSSSSSASDASATIHKQPPASPVCVSERLTKAGMDMQDYQSLVTKLTQEQLFHRQQKLLRMSMQKTEDSRRALYHKNAALLLQGKQAQQKLVRVLQDIESSSLKIKDTYRQQQQRHHHHQEPTKTPSSSH